MVTAQANSESKPQLVNYQPPSSFSDDLKVMKAMYLSKITGNSLQEQLESFYKDQADLYDMYRHRMLHGRFPMAQAMPAPKGGVWVDLGGGTGSNLEFFGDSLSHWGKVYVLDLCSALVVEARKRVEDRGWTDLVTVIEGDATDVDTPGLPPKGTVDLVSFSYALSMIPEWKKAVQVALSLLKPGGSIAVCDFTVTKEQWMGMGASFWKSVFATDHVYPTEEHLAELRRVFKEDSCQTGTGGFPYVPVLRCPWYAFVGQKVEGRQEQEQP